MDLGGIESRWPLSGYLPKASRKSWPIKRKTATNERVEKFMTLAIAAGADLVILIWICFWNESGIVLV